MAFIIFRQAIRNAARFSLYSNVFGIIGLKYFVILKQLTAKTQICKEYYGYLCRLYSYLLTFFLFAPDTFIIIFAIMFLIISVIWIIGIKSILVNDVRAQLNRSNKWGEVPIGKTITLTFESDYFVEITKEIETKVKYAGVEKVVDYANQVYLFIHPNVAFIMPLSIFSNQVQRFAFLDFIKEKAVCASIETL